jgi:hypothetical protein
MRSILPLILCVFTLGASSAYAQSLNIEPMHAAAGTVLTFYMQTRMNPNAGSALDALPKGTVLRVRLLDSIDSSVDRDGTQFRGALVSAVVSQDKEVLRSAAEVRGLLVLLRSRNHPEGFRYELLITSVTENGKSYALTASLNPSFVDDTKPRAHNGTAAAGGNASAKDATAGNTKLPDGLHK